MGKGNGFQDPMEMTARLSIILDFEGVIRPEQVVVSAVRHDQGFERPARKWAKIETDAR